MNTALTVLVLVCTIAGGLALGTLVLVGLIRWLHRPVEPPECCVNGEE